ncbi:hypothetical protein FY034_13090 [Trichlorobacter lovleyi]|uniref:hypothetical protein n=1 Tax=Trichlorobacter lovleyi TaxID=313985 RepID=UPI0022400BB9|nr:hypothetical protein [Trichlorobacter lovleyi]QOX79826.1 hypothetical protein FY034_13090 [Trichlorobacter lovleyi]
MDYIFLAGIVVAIGIFCGLVRIAWAIERRVINVNLPMPIALKHIMTETAEEEADHV